VFPTDEDVAVARRVSVAGSLARPELAPKLVQRMEQWIVFCEDAIAKTLGRSPVGELVRGRDLAYALVTFYLGINLVTHLDADSTQTTRSLRANEGGAYRPRPRRHNVLEGLDVVGAGVAAAVDEEGRRAETPLRSAVSTSSRSARRRTG
jgi:hypothetical protein